MSSTSSVNAPPQPHLTIAEDRGPSWGFWAVACLALAALGTAGAWAAGLINPRRLWTPQTVALKTLPVDEGTLYVVVTEYGSLESSNNATVRCQVEALIGLVGGAAQQPGAAGGRPGGVPGQGGRQGGGPGGAGGAQGGQQQQQQQQPSAAKKKAQTNAGAAGKAAGGAGASLVTGAQAGAAGTNPGAGATPSSGGGGATGGGGGGGGAGGPGGGAGGAAGGAGGAGGTTTPVAVKPVIRSFTYMVPPYMPLRPKVPGAQQAQPKQQMDPNMMGGGGGGRGGGGSRGGRGGDPMNQEKPGSTRIISILPEGTRVKAGDVVCELDSAAFKDELQAQKIRWNQAKALVEQAQAILDVNEITLKEYQDGIFPQDEQLVRQYLTTCEIDTDRTRRNLEWSRQTFAKGFRASAQVKADAAANEQAEIALREAKGMIERLEKFTGPRLIKNLMAKNEAIKADKLAQESVYQLESDRLRRLEEMVANCTLRAPRDGIVVYANQSNSWGRTEALIQEGVTVRQGQAIVNLPDPNHMQVRARVNESKVSSISSGQKAEIRVDAFPDRPMMGTVASVTPIPAPAGGSGQDVRVYYATVEIDSGGFDDLRPGLSAEVTFLVEQPRKVTRVPLQAVRWVNDTPYVAVSEKPAPGRNVASFRWQTPTLGQSDASHIEVLSGLRAGDRVLARPDLLPSPARAAAVAGAGATPPARPRG